MLFTRWQCVRIRKNKIIGKEPDNDVFCADRVLDIINASEDGYLSQKEINLACGFVTENSKVIRVVTTHETEGLLERLSTEEVVKLVLDNNFLFKHKLLKPRGHLPTVFRVINE